MPAKTGKTFLNTLLNKPDTRFVVEFAAPVTQPSLSAAPTTRLFAMKADLLSGKQSVTKTLVQSKRASQSAKRVAQLNGGTTASAPPASPELDKLTPREKEILACLARGESNKVIARSLDLAESTVKIHVQNMLKKLKLSSRVQAAMFAVEHRMSGSCVYLRHAETARMKSTPL